MKKYRVALTYDSWKNGQGWEVENAYMGIDDTITDDKEVLNYTKEDLISNMLDYVSDEIANYNEDRSDTRYDYTVYEVNEAGDENEVYTISVWLSELAKQ